MHDDIHASDGFSDHADLGQLGGGAPGDLGHAQRSQLRLERLQLLGELILVLGAQLRTLDTTLKTRGNNLSRVRDTKRRDEARQRGQALSEGKLKTLIGIFKRYFVATRPLFEGSVE